MKRTIFQLQKITIRLLLIALVVGCNKGKTTPDADQNSDSGDMVNATDSNDVLTDSADTVHSQDSADTVPPQDSSDSEQMQQTEDTGTITCSGISTPSETFTSTDQPQTEEIGALAYINTPWGYNKSANADRLYPILVHGCWGEGEYFTEAILKKNPAFQMDFQGCDTDEEGAQLANILNTAVSMGLRIDMDRVYLTGFSKGGSGSYKLVRGFLSEGELFAAIIRVAGGSESVLPDEAVAQTALWYHVGTEDNEERVQVAADAYDFLKSHTRNESARETTVTDELTGYQRTTKTLTRNKIEMVKYSVYDGMGHEPGPVYSDPYIFEWLFSQSLSCHVQ